MQKVVLWAETRWPGFSDSLRMVNEGPTISAIDHILNQDLQGVMELFMQIQYVLDKQQGLSLRDIVILDQLGICLFE